jgi:hypothetical protein
MINFEEDYNKESYLKILQGLKKYYLHVDLKDIK